MTFPILGGNSAVTGAYSIDNSLRFNDDDTAKLAATLSASNRKTFTWSGWVKRSNLGTIQGLFSVDTGASESTLGFLADDTLRFALGLAPTYPLIETTQVFRDVSAWYHIVFAVDTTQATQENRVKLYVNGSQITAFDTASYPPQNADTEFNTANPHEIGFYSNQTGGAGYFDGYMADVHFIDGTAKSPTDFGEFDEDSGIWKPKEYDGSYGTNGFKLDFSNSGSLGADSSPNSNNFTPTNLASTDQTTDTPTNNFATWNNNIAMNSTATIAEGNLEATTGTNYANYASNAWFSSIGVSSGKWYAEFKLSAGSADQAQIVGVAYNLSKFQQGSSGNAYGLYDNDNGWGYIGAEGKVKNNNSDVLTGLTTWYTNAIISVALDLDNHKLYFRINGASWENSGNPESGATGTGAVSLTSNQEYFFAVSDASISQYYTFQANFGNPVHSISSGNTDDNGYGNFEYAPPSGYLALCTQNLATELSPTIDDGSQYFNTILYTGTGTTQSITGVGFQPDLVWLKARTQSYYHNWYDIIRGGTKAIFSNADVPEATDTGNLQTLDSDGFTADGFGGTNGSGVNYVAWNWLASNTTASNTNGSITSTVSVNQTSGFSVVTYTGTGANATVGHGLGKVPAMMIIKNRSASANWIVYHQDLGNNNAIVLNSSGASFSAGDFQNTTPTSSVFSVGTSTSVNGSGNNIVAYTFAEIEGYSKFGKWTGTGTQPSPFVYTGFKPSWIMYKRVDTSSIWVMIDAKRSPINSTDKYLRADTTATESTYDILNFMSNGFEIDIISPDASTNTSGADVIYMCFAENPFVTSSGVPNTAK